MEYPTQRPTSTFQTNGLGQAGYKEPFESMSRSFDTLLKAHGTMQGVAEAYQQAGRWQLFGLLAGAALSLGLGTMKGYNKRYWAMLPVFPVVGALTGRAIGFRMAKPRPASATASPAANANGNGAMPPGNGALI